MKLLNIKKIILSISLGLVVCSCSKKEENLAPELTANDVKSIVKTDQVFQDVFGLAQNNSFFNKAAAKGTNSTTVSCFFKNVISIGEGQKVMLDFGNGCDFFGKKYEGKLEIVYQEIDGGYKKSFSFNGFSIDGTKVAGSTDFSITLKNDNGNFAVVARGDLAIELATGEKVTRKGTWNLEKVEGTNTILTLSDDVYAITGSWESLSLDGFARNISISKPLKTKFGCVFASEGTLSINYGNRNYIVDFGNGKCDDVISFTDAKGNVTEISVL